MYRKTYAVVDLNCIANNISELRRCAGTEVMAVVKADAYGHGVEKVSKRAGEIFCRGDAGGGSGA